MRVALIYPPSCDPTAPYLSLPTLAGWLRAHGVEVTLIDANVEAWEELLRRERIDELGEKLERRLHRLDRRPSLSHTEQLAYATLVKALGDAALARQSIDQALATFRDPARFYDAARYEEAVAAVDAAQRVISAAHAPLSVDFVSYRTPFSLLTAEEIAHDARADRDPFHRTFSAIAERLASDPPDIVGISVAFPGQVQPAYSLAHVLRARVPDLHVTVGGPALTQMMLRLEGERLERALGPFSSAVVYEGEEALLQMVRRTERGEHPTLGQRVVQGTMIEDLSRLPAPDFDGLPLDRYLAPELVLPYDPSRGCYWGVCTFCHYGLAEVGTARYRERPIETVLDHLESLQAKHGTRLFYFSQDVFAPRIAVDIARGVSRRGLRIRWGSDMRPERSLNTDRAKELARGGALSTAIGVESASPRVLSLIDKGIPAGDVRKVIQSLSAAGIAVEAMCFSDFPTESYREALETVRFVQELRDCLSLFILGRFDLTHGSLVAQRPGEFGISEVWSVEGDELGTGLFFAERQRSKRPADQERLEGAVSELSGNWRLRRYPWAGALSTAHTMLYYDRFGRDVFRRSTATRRPVAPKGVTYQARYDALAIHETSASREAELWEELVYRDRRVTRAAYREKADRLPHARPSPRRFVSVAGEDPRPAGRRPSHAHNSTRQ